MGNGLIAFLFSIGATTWITNKFYKRTGGNMTKSLGAGLTVGAIAFLLLLTILWQIQ
jgi:hypothetical protein